MDFKIKTQDLYNFLKQNGYEWTSLEASVNEGDYFCEVTDNLLYDEFYNGTSCELELVLTKQKHNISAFISFNDFKFKLKENVYLTEKVSIDLSKKWVNYLLINYKDYANFLDNWYKTEKQEVVNFFDEKIKKLEEEIVDCKKQCVERIEKLNEYKKILLNYQTKTIKKETEELTQIK